MRKQRRSGNPLNPCFSADDEQHPYIHIKHEVTEELHDCTRLKHMIYRIKKYVTDSV